MLIISEDPDGRFALSTNERLVIRETIDSVHYSVLHIDSTQEGFSGWIVIKDTSVEKVQEKFSALITLWKKEHKLKDFEVFDLNDEDEQ